MVAAYVVVGAAAVVAVDAAVVAAAAATAAAAAVAAGAVAALWLPVSPLALGSAGTPDAVRREQAVPTLVPPLRWGLLTCSAVSACRYWRGFHAEFDHVLGDAPASNA